MVADMLENCAGGRGDPSRFFNSLGRGLEGHRAQHMPDLTTHETPPRDVLSEVMELYDTAIEVFTETMREAREDGRVKEANSYVRELGKIVLAVITEREKIDKLRRQETGGTGGGALDLDAARDEIGRRLARLRDAGDA
ncbi:hypothetical protein CG51_16420 [Haematobacter missouriensis]|uniref:Uncharacterized protein n=2 Tax=Haematobacter missouriensis TaxID=366616 RepID=A0A212AYG3_9RHOB|nr:hypothetical protein CG51_16420 [Haematobacter missouriensis]OWJ78611.1 hypothetical protein CDV53_02830 [Haematobacter missouriensis]OWJ86511.1 hypothetical protein CDV52_00700 [Haematobacter missouriensis]